MVDNNNKYKILSLLRASLNTHTASPNADHSTYVGGAAVPISCTTIFKFSTSARKSRTSSNEIAGCGLGAIGTGKAEGHDGCIVGRASATIVVLAIFPVRII